MNLMGKCFAKNELLKRVGDISQIAGIKRYTLSEGRGGGTDIVEVRTGDGFYFSVVPGRCLDIAWVEDCGRPIGYMSKAGIVSAAYYEPADMWWNRSFFGGALTTCGLTNAGLPYKENGEAVGLHGRISNTPAEEVCTESFWDNDTLTMVVKGKVREACLFRESLILTRKISGKIGEKKILIEDKVENTSFIDVPFMILYHINFGFPVISRDSRLVIPSTKITPKDFRSESDIGRCRSFEDPTPGYIEEAFFHSLASDRNKDTIVGIVNDSIKFGAYIKFNVGQLPYLTEWKMMGEQDYVVGVEPGNCIPEGRASASNRKVLKFLKPGETWETSIELGSISGTEQVEKLEQSVKDLNELVYPPAFSNP